MFFTMSFCLCALFSAQKIKIEQKAITRTVAPNNNSVVVNVDGNLLVESFITVEEIVPKNSKTVIVDGIERTVDPLLLVRSNESEPKGELKMLDISKRLVGPVNKFLVKVDNLDSDQLVRLSTNLLKDKYVVAITDAVFSNATLNSIDLLINSRDKNKHFGAFSTEVNTVKVEYTFPKKECTTTVVNGLEKTTCTTHPSNKVKKELEFYAVDLDFKGSGIVSNDKKGTWTFSLVVYEKALVKQWPDIVSNVSINSSNYPVGTSTATPEGFTKKNAN